MAGLERRRLLEATPDPTDSRQRLIALSPAGSALYRKVVVSRERLRRLPAPLGDEEQRALAGLLRRLHAHLASCDAFDPDASSAEADPDAA